MADYRDSDILVATSSADVLLSLSCGYGQPVATRVYIQQIGGATHELVSFTGDTEGLKVGTSDSLNKQRVIVYSTIHDVRDVNSGQEVEDIHLIDKLSCGDVSVDASFIKKTKGAGELVVCKYEVIVMKQ